MHVVSDEPESPANAPRRSKTEAREAPIATAWSSYLHCCLFLAKDLIGCGLVACKTRGSPSRNFCVIQEKKKKRLWNWTGTMGAVHGVYLKYVGLSAVSYAGYSFCVGGFGPIGIEPLPLAGGGILATSGEQSSLIPLLRYGASSIFKYSAALNGTIAILFKLRRGKPTSCPVPGRRTLRPQEAII